MTPDAEHLYRYLVRRGGRAGTIPSQATIATDLGWSVSTVKRRIRDLRAAGWLDTDRRPQRNARRSGLLRGGNAYYPKVALPDLEPLAGNESDAFAQVATRDHTPEHRFPRSQRGISRASWSLVGDEEPSITAGRNEGSAERAGSEHLKERQQGEWVQGDKGEGAHEPVAPIEPAAVLDVGHQHEPTWADQRLDADGILDRLRGQLGDIQVFGVVSNDDPERDAKLRALHTNGQPVVNDQPPAIYRTARGRVIDLATAPTQDLHQAVDQLERHTCHRVNGNGSERCTPDQSCGRHTARRRAR